MLVGRDPGDQEVRQGKPFVGPAGALLERCMGLAGLRRKDVSITNVVGVQPPKNVFQLHSRSDVERGISELHRLIREQRPNLVVALGNEASYALTGDWPARGGTIYTASGIQERRGYFWWNEELDTKILTTLHPSGILRGEGYGNAAVNQMLLTYDLERAREQGRTARLVRPKREVAVVSTPQQAATAMKAIRRSRLSACDIEIFDVQRLSCVGFAPSTSKAYVFTEAQFDAAFALLADPRVKLCFHNGQFDTHFLLTRCGIETTGFSDDTIVAFHICWPALAGKGERSSRRTQKSLKFLASLYTLDRWWKDYDFENLNEMYYLNGVDCMSTLEIHQRLKVERKHLQISDEIYEHEMSMIWPTVKMLERGIRVDEKKLEANLQSLDELLDGLVGGLGEVVKPLLEEAREGISRPALFWKKKTCRCCGGGKKKRAQCWGCAGCTKAPGKAELVALCGDWGAEKMKKADLEKRVLAPCQKCAGEGSWEEFSFNFDSTDQKKILLYEVLKIPTRFHKGKASVAEEKMKDILGGLG